MTEANKEALRKLAEKMIARSKDSRNHECDAPDSECFGCDSMRTGLEILAFIGDEDIYQA
ncbi:MAG: hypothetical protein JSS83_19365 [Cyanobacteria bacterium SZAS LIN-3]|nr:hypothetical protein [Cyanobacteria bacterium SZAS LIN-3]